MPSLVLRTTHKRSANTSLRRGQNEEPQYDSFAEAKKKDWRKNVAPYYRNPSSIEVITDVDGKIVPVGMNPLVEPGARRWRMAIPDEIPPEWKPTKDTSLEYQRAMNRYQEEMAQRRIRAFPQNHIRYTMNADDPGFNDDKDGKALQSYDKEGNLLNNYQNVDDGDLVINAQQYEQLDDDRRTRYREQVPSNVVGNENLWNLNLQQRLAQGGRGRGKGMRGKGGGGSKWSSKKKMVHTDTVPRTGREKVMFRPRTFPITSEANRVRLAAG